MNMNWRRVDLVLLGRLAGLGIIVAGIMLAVWELADVPGPFWTKDSFQFLLYNVLSYVGTGGLLILAAEIADRLTWSWDEEELEEGETS
jgi:hypothetical protein